MEVDDAIADDEAEHGQTVVPTGDLIVAGSILFYQTTTELLDGLHRTRRADWQAKKATLDELMQSLA